MHPVAPVPERGQIVRVRSRQYLVEERVAPQADGDAHLVRLACVDDDAQGQRLELLWEHEPDAELLGGGSWRELARRGFDPKPLFAGYLNALRWSCVTATDARLFQSPFRAGIQLHAYQLEPLRKALLLPRVNLFIADDVGLGKTIEAGLIASELLLRRKVRDVVIACPPSVLLQWQEEMGTRFGLSFELLDRAYVARVRRERGWSANPWSTHTRFVVSHRLLVDEEYAGPLRAWLDELRPGSLLVVDEAHNAAPSSGARYAVDSQLTRALRELARRFEHRLFLSATPHNGHSNSFSALLEILDPQRFCRGVEVRRKPLEEVMVRRLKDDLRAVVGGLPARKVVQVDLADVPDDAPELVLSRLLDRYRELREERLGDESRRRRSAGQLLVTGLQQRLLSSIEAFARTLRVHRRTVEREWAAIERGEARPRAPFRASFTLLAAPPDPEDDAALLPDDERAEEEDAQVEAATRAAMGGLDAPGARDRFARERALLDEMSAVAEGARALPDARVRWLVGWIGEHMCPGLPPVGEAPRAGRPLAWNGTRLLVFTEFDDTKRWLERLLREAVAGTDRADERIDVFHGPTPPVRREEIKRAFNADPRRHPLRILVATDAAREGVNLQSHCRHLFHLDVPWNPSRLEQRNGRIDRKLQPAPEVFCHYFVYPKRPEDRVLRVLVKKTDRIRRELGSLSQVLEARLADTLRTGIAHRDAERLERAVEDEELDPARRAVVEAELEEGRARSGRLGEELDRLRTQLEDSKEVIGFEADAFRAALDASLSLAGGTPLSPSTAPAADPALPPRFAFPALDAREGADPTWADALDALRAPRGRDQTLWQWRRESPLRPVVFAAPPTMDDDVVQLHLAHPLAERLLSRFLAQGFVHHDLSRACLAQTADAVPRVLLLGRLSLYGPGAARLHEEVLAVTARWHAPAQRKESLRPYAPEAETRTVDLLDRALRPDTRGEVPEPVRRELLAAAARDVEELRPHLDERGRRLAGAAAEKLRARAEEEARRMVEILDAQRKHIEATVARHEDPQLSLGFDEAALRQLEADRRHWRARLARIERERVEEPARIRGVYEVRAHRLEAVGLAYLWPVTG